MRVVAQFDPSQKTSDTFNTLFPNGTGKMVVYNESGINLTLSWGASTAYCPAWTAMLYCVTTNNINISWTQQSTLQIYNAPISQVVVEAYNANEPVIGTFPAPLHRQTATSLVGNTNTTFSATFGIGVSAGFRQALNIFNPPNSGVNFTFHSVRAYTNETTIPTGNLILLSGADLNLPTAVSAVPHTGSATPAVSFAHCTAMDQNPGNSLTSVIETIQMQSLVTIDFLSFPDSFTLAPGNNLRVEVISSSASHNVRLTMKWSESTSVSTATGGGPSGVATSIQNDGLPSPQTLVEATPQGDSSSAVRLLTDGTLQLGNATHHGHTSIDNGAISSDGSGNLTVGSLQLPTGSFTRMSIFTGTATVAGAVTPHGLGAVPDGIFLTFPDLHTTTHVCSYDKTTLTSTNVTLYGDTTIGVIGLAIKK